MANEYGIVTTVDASGATVAAREFKRAITDISGSAAKAVKSVDVVTKAFRELGTRLGSTTTSMRNTLKQLASETGRSGTAISSGFLKASRSMTNSAERIERQAVRTTTALRTFSLGAIQSNNQLATSIQRIPSVQARATTAVVQSNARATASFTSLGTAVANLRPLLLSVFAGFGAGAVVKQIATFDQSIAQIRALMGPQALQKDIDAVTAKARELGASTVFAGTDAAAAMAELVRAGFSTEQAMTAAGAALDLAAADSLDMATAAGITANILASFGMAATEATHASDVMAYAANASQSDVRGVGEAMKYAGSMAKTVGVTLEDAAAAVGTLSNAGLEASMAGTGLRSVLAGIVGPTKQAREAMAALGLNAGKLAGTLRTEDGLIKAIGMFSDAQKQLGNDTEFAEKALAIFGQRGGPALLALVNNVDGLRGLATGMKSVDGIARQMADTMTDSLVGAWKELESASEELILQLGDAGLKGLLRSSAENLGAFGRGLAGMSEEAGKASERMVTLNSVGKTLRDNLEALKDLAILLASVYATRLVIALTASTAAKVKDAWATATLNAQSKITATTFNGMTTVVRTATTAQIAATAATNGLRVAVAALGGPIGLIVTLATSAAAAVLLFGDNADSARKAADDLSGSLEQLAGKYAAAGAEQRKLLTQQAKATASEAGKRIPELDAQIREAEEANKRYDQMRRNFGPNPTDNQAMRLARAAQGSMSDIQLQALRAEKERMEEVVKQSNDVLIDFMRADLAPYQQAAVAVKGATAEVADVVEESAGAAKEAAKEFNQFKNAADSVLKSANPLAAASKEYAENLATLQRMAKMSASELSKLGYTHDQVRVATTNLTDAWTKAQKELDPLYVKYEKLRDSFDSAAKSVRPAAVAQKEYNEQVAKANALLALTDTELARAGYTRAEVTQGIADMTKELEENTKKAANNGKQADTWETMWKRAIERVDDAFVDLWKSAFSGGKDFAKSLKDTFKQMLAEIAHANLTKPLTSYMSQLLGAGSNTATGGTGTLTGALGNSNGLLKTISSGLTNVFKSAATSAANGTGWFSGLWNGIKGAGGSSFGGLFGSGAAASTTTMSNFSNALKGFTGLWTSSSGQLASAGSLAGFGNNVGGLAASGATSGSAAASGAASAGMAVPIIGAIIAGMMANDKFFAEGWRMDGQTSDITKSLMGSTLKGNIFGPILGSMTMGIGAVDRGLKSLGLNDRFASLISGSALWTRAFGRSAPKITDQGIDGSAGLGGFTGQQWANVKQKGGWFRSDKKWTQTAAMDPQIQTYIDGTTLAVRNMIKTISEDTNFEAAKGLKGLSVTLGKITLDKDADKAKQQIEDYANQLSEALAKSALNALKFGSIASDTTSDTSQADRLGLVQGMLSMLSTDTAKSATDAYNDSLKSGMELYREQSVKLTELMGKYDGTVASFTELTEATAGLKDTQLSLMVAFKQLADYGKSLFGGTQQSIRESLMTTDQLYTTRQNQIQELMAQMRTESDPTKLKDMADRINSLTTDAYGMLEEDQKRAMAGGFIAFLDEAEALLRDRAEKGYDTVAGEAGGLNDAVSARLSQAADKQAEAANVFLQAVQTFAASVGGGGISSSRGTNARYNEV